MSAKRPLSPSDIRAWLEETRHDTVLVEPPPMPAEEPQTATDGPVPKTKARIIQTPAQGSKSATPLAIGETHQMDKSLARKFSRGSLPLDATLDLHGMQQQAAYDAVQHFIAYHAGRGGRHVCIVTGKGTRGGGVLREKIGDWLNMPSARSVIISAIYGAPHRGGEGAVYVLLKRHAKQPNQ